MLIQATLTGGTTEVTLEFEHDGVGYVDSVVLDRQYPLVGTYDLGIVSYYSHPAYVAICTAMDAQGWVESDGYWVEPPPSVLEPVT